MVLREGERKGRRKREGISVFLKQNLQCCVARRLKLTKPSLEFPLEIMDVKFTMIMANLICSSCGILYLLMPRKNGL